MLNREQASALLEWAGAQNPGPWTQHSLHVARAAEAIASRCGMDAGRAWVLGALHDIGRWEGVRALHHAIAGYRLIDVALRHGVLANAPEKWRAVFAIRDQFERRMGTSIYAPFDEAVSNTFAAPIG